MKKVAYSPRNKQPESVADIILDWKDSPDKVMKSVDEALRKHGLRVVVHQTNDCSHAYSIRKIR